MEMQANSNVFGIVKKNNIGQSAAKLPFMVKGSTTISTLK